MQGERKETHTNEEHKGRQGKSKREGKRAGKKRLGGIGKGRTEDEDERGKNKGSCVILQEQKTFCPSS